jgi:anti-sigma factor RsiW
MTNHLTWETLNDLVDDLLSASERQAAEHHARECASCARAVDELKATVAGVHELPRSVMPPDELWSSIRETIESKKVAHLPSGAVARQAAGWWVTPGRLAAAAVMLIALTATITSVAVRPRQAPAVALTSAATLTASWQASERAFLASVLELRGELEALHDHLSPETLVKVERALATIDLAIAEGREELIRNPANAALSELVASNYRQKIELLRRMTQLASAT